MSRRSGIAPVPCPLQGPRQAAQAGAKQQETARRREEDERIAYDRYRRQEATRLFETLPTEEQQAIEAQAEQAAAHFDGSLRDTMRGVNRTKITAQRHHDRIKTLEEWRSRRMKRQGVGSD